MQGLKSNIANLTLLSLIVFFAPARANMSSENAQMEQEEFVNQAPAEMTVPSSDAIEKANTLINQITSLDQQELQAFINCLEEKYNVATPGMERMPMLQRETDDAKLTALNKWYANLKKCHVVTVGKIVIPIALFYVYHVYVADMLATKFPHLKDFPKEFVKLFLAIWAADRIKEHAHAIEDAVFNVLEGPTDDESGAEAAQA